MLEARSLTKRFGDVMALEAIDLSVAPGEIHCLLGANGAAPCWTATWLNRRRGRSARRGACWR